jgi:predicted dehydrogenase
VTRLAVIGVGHLGRHHARILSAMPDVALVGIVDINQERAKQVASTNSTQSIRDAADLVGRVDGVVVATPTESHAAIARRFLEGGVAVLIEKPLARSMAEADDLVRLASERQTMLAVGHTERFNPAVTAARPLLTTPRFIEVHRLGSFPDRSLDIDVVFDLMIHDLDVVLSIVNSPVAAIDAVGVPVLTPRIDIANVRLRFQSGCIVNLTASRISRDRTRKIRFFQPESYVAIDYAAQEVEVWRLVRQPAGMPTIEGGPVAVVSNEPLKCELDDFVDAIRNRRAPQVTGEDGRRALALAQEISEQMVLTTNLTQGGASANSL